jgi:GNAT superfamily N-acetyltransferase
MPTLRPFIPADQTAVRELILAGLGQRFGTADPSLTPDLDDIQASYLAHDAYFVVVEAAEDSQIIACGALIHEPNQPEAMRIVRVSVRGDWQGRGLGRLVSHALLDEAHQRGLARVLVETNSDWHSALRLYHALGFTEYAHNHNPEFGYTEVEMSLNL